MKQILTLILGAAIVSLIASCARQASPAGKSTKLNFQISGAT